MNAPTERLQPVRATLAGALQADGQTQAQADDLLDQAVATQNEQTALLETFPLAAEYSAAFAAQVEAKHDQAERIEDRLENMIEQQESRLQQIEAKQPGILSLPGQRARWQSQVQQQQTLLQRLHTRMENVREIKEGMGVHAPRIEELATRKLRAEQPELAEGWDEMREATRRHQELMRKQDRDRRIKLARESNGDDGQSHGRGRTLELSQAPKL